MQTRPYPEKDGEVVWLNQAEQQTLLNAIEEEPRKHIAFWLGLNGLRTDEIVRVTSDHVRELGDTQSALLVPRGKTGRREVPIPDGLASLIRTVANATGTAKSEPIIDVSKRTLRNWMADKRDVLDCENLGMHDLRRSWATDTFYTLAFNGVPIAEELVMSFGGWKQTQTGRQTFRENYLGPVPDHIAEQAAGLLFDDSATA